MPIKMLTFNSREEWLANRTKGIGGSEISAIVGQNPYMNNVELFEYKTGRKQPEDISDKPYVIYGTKAEEHMREMFKLDFPDLKVSYTDNNCFINDKFPWAQASLDGWIEDQDGRRGILEIKTTEILQSMHREKWKDAIPMNYYCQTLFYMAVYEADFTILKARLKTVFDGIPSAQIKHYKIERQEVKDDIEFLMQKGSEFWHNYVLTGKQPPLRLPELI